MKPDQRRIASSPKIAALASAVTIAAAAFAAAAQAQSNGPIKIGVIAEAQAVAGSSIPLAAQLAADEINAAGGVNGRKIEIVSYDNHSSAAESVRAFQRAVNEDHVNAVIASYVSEVVLALEPWTGRLKTVMITPGAASDVITQNIAKDYDHLKYTFHGYSTSTSIADATCDAAKDLLIKDLKMKSAVVISEDAAWTTPLDAEYLKCLPQIGLKVLDHIRVSPDTTDFTPIYNKIEVEKPDVMITGISARRRAADGAMEAAGSSDTDVRGVLAGLEFELLAGHQRRRRGRALSGVLRTRCGGHAEDAAVRRGVQEATSAISRPIAATPPMTRSIILSMHSSRRARAIPTSSWKRWKRPISSAPSAAYSSKARTCPIRTRSRSAPAPSPA